MVAQLAEGLPNKATLVAGIANKGKVKLYFRFYFQDHKKKKNNFTVSLNDKSLRVQKICRTQTKTMQKRHKAVFFNK